MNPSEHFDGNYRAESAAMDEKPEISKKRKLGIKDILYLQGAFILFSLSSVMTNFAASELDSFASVFTWRFILFAGLTLLILGAYAIIWQQLIKRFDLSIAYTNKATSLFWVLIWGVLFFQEEITLQKIIGVLVVFSGVVLMNSEALQKKE